MKIVVFAEQFRNGCWDVWEHTCGPNEAKAIVDSANAKAAGHSLNGRPTHKDLLESARQLFDVAHGPADNPGDGDLRVYCVCVDQFVIGVYDKISRYSQRVMEAHEPVEVALRRTA